MAHGCLNSQDTLPTLAKGQQHPLPAFPQEVGSPPPPRGALGQSPVGEQMLLPGYHLTHVASPILTALLGQVHSRCSINAPCVNEPGFVARCAKSKRSLGVIPNTLCLGQVTVTLGPRM